jgi:hypothetical protein
MTRSIFFAATLALAATLSTVTANAQTAIRTFVSTAGSDSNPCTITQPCRHFQAAVAVTALGGEVDALEPGAYGSFIIGQAITIEGQGWSYVAPGANGNAITINAGSGIVTIRGVSLNGIGGGAHGIFSTGSGSINIIDTMVTNFADSGIAIQPGTGALNLTISNSSSLNNGVDGIKIAPTGSSTSVYYSIDQTTTNSNGANGFEFDGSGIDSLQGSITRSQANLNASSGIYFSAVGDTVIKNCYANKNNFGISVTNASELYVSGSEFFTNSTDDISIDASELFSLGDNVYISISGGNLLYQTPLH